MGGTALPMTLSALEDILMPDFNSLLILRLTKEDGFARVHTSLDRLVAMHPMLRTIHRPPVFWICANVQYILDESAIPARDYHLCQNLRWAKLDLTVAPFRARIYSVDGEAAFLAMLIVHAVADGPSLQIIHANLSQLLASERSQKAHTTPVAAYDTTNKVARHAILSHVRSLSADSAAFPTHILPVRLPCELANKPSYSTTAQNTSQNISYNLPNQFYSRLESVAAENNLTTNALVLGKLATLIYQESGQPEFAVRQTFLGRSHNQLETVGSFSTQAPIFFSFMDAPDLKATCSHVLQQTQQIMSLEDMIIPSAANDLCTERCNICYENNDMTQVSLAEIGLQTPGTATELPFCICDLFFMITRCSDRVAITAIYRLGIYEETQLREFLSQWISLLHDTDTIRFMLQK
jgi:hypothetical protein